jgi:carbon starvation protein CstA
VATARHEDRLEPPAHAHLSKWGIASLALLLGGYAVDKYNLYLYDQGRERLFFYFATANQFCVIVELGAVVCGALAMRRQSKWWLLTVVPAVLLTVVCFFGDL